MSASGLPKNPAALAALAFAWTFCLLAGLTFLWQALFKKPKPSSSKLRNILQGILFRFRFVAGVGLLTLVVYGVAWALANWR